MSDCSDMEYSSDNECEYDDYYNTGLCADFSCIDLVFVLGHIAL